MRQGFTEPCLLKESASPSPLMLPRYSLAIVYLRIGSHWDKGKCQEELGSGIEK